MSFKAIIEEVKEPETFYPRLMQARDGSIALAVSHEQGTILKVGKGMSYRAGDYGTDFNFDKPEFWKVFNSKVILSNECENTD